jgi:hypothetical protein
LDLSTSNETNCGGSIIAEFSGHKYAVNCVVSLILRAINLLRVSTNIKY